MSAPTMMPSQWRPIETAPKDGTRVLLYRPYTQEVLTGWFKSGPETGWYSGAICHLIQASHWMPLPPRPTEAGTSRTVLPRSQVEVERDLYRTALGHIARSSRDADARRIADLALERASTLAGER